MDTSASMDIGGAPQSANVFQVLDTPQTSSEGAPNSDTFPQNNAPLHVSNEPQSKRTNGSPMDMEEEAEEYEQEVAEYSMENIGQEPLVANRESYDEHLPEESIPKRFSEECVTNVNVMKARKSDICRICHETSELEMCPSSGRDFTTSSRESFSVRPQNSLADEDDRTAIGPLESPCRCKGTIGLVHRSCLERWLSETRRCSCELCGFRYELAIVPRLTAFRSFVSWIRVPRGRGTILIWDLMRVLVLIPLCLTSMYLSILLLVHAIETIANCSAYALEGLPLTEIPRCRTWNFITTFAKATVGQSEFPHADPELLKGILAGSLFLMSMISASALFIWCLTSAILSVNDHFEAWHRWWQMDSIVRLLDPQPEDARETAEENPYLDLLL